MCWPTTATRGTRRHRGAGASTEVRIETRGRSEVRRCALALGRECERRVPELATTAWWKEERHGVFIDYNQNARDRTVASAYSVRPTPNAQVSTPLEWNEVASVELADFTIANVPQRFAERGDPAAGIDARAFSLEPLLELATQQEAAGLGDAPYPPHYPKAPGEPARVQPSKARKNEAAARAPRRGGGGKEGVLKTDPPGALQSPMTTFHSRMRWAVTRPLAT